MLEQKELLGISCHLFTIDTLDEIVINEIRAGHQTIIANHNLHSVYLFHNNKDFKDFYKHAEYVHIDGMPLVYWGKIIGQKVSRKNRITYVDWVNSLMDLANRNRLRIFYLGGKPGVARSAIDKLQIEFSDIEFQARHGYFDMFNDEENTSVLETIELFRPNILMVGMSMPRQELWIKNNIDHLPNCVILPCGACFDYLGGEVKTPPRFLGSIGLEWLYRFLQEPRRLFSRYFLEPFFLVPFFVKDLKSRFFKKLRLRT